MISSKIQLVKFIFLDIDGVLNSSNSLEYNPSINYSLIHNGIDGSTFYEYNYELSKLDSKPIQLINSLVEQTKSEIIISSDWRLGYSVGQLINFFARRAATFKLHGMTPRIVGGNRPEEIEEYLDPFKDKRHFNLKYVILDDDRKYFRKSKCKDNFIHIDKNIGLTQKDIDKAIEILNG